MSLEPGVTARQGGVSVVWRGDREGELVADGHAAIVGAPWLAGSMGHAWTAGELLCGALLVGYMTTLLAGAERAHVAIKAFRADAEGALDVTTDGPRLTGVRIHVDIEADDVARVTEVVDKAKWSSVVTSALATTVTVESHVRKH